MITAQPESPSKMRKRTLPNTENAEPSNKKRKILSCNEEDPELNIRIPKMIGELEYQNADANTSNHNTNNRNVSTTNRKHEREIRIESSQSVPPPAKQLLSTSSCKSHVIDLCDHDEEIIVGSVQYREYKQQLKKRRKEHRRRKKRKRKKHIHSASKRRKGSSKYPRKCKLGGIKWKRKYSVEEKRYYWVQKNNESVTSWDPFKDNGTIAPWLHDQGYWEKWCNAENDRYYYYNPLNGVSQYQRPTDYQSPEEIDHDSMDDHLRIRIEPESVSQHAGSADVDVQVVGVERPKKAYKPPKKVSNAPAIRCKSLDPNAGVFSFLNVSTSSPPTGVMAADDTNNGNDTKKDEHVNKVVNGLKEVMYKRKRKSMNTKISDDTQAQNQMARRESTAESNAIFGMDGDREKAGRYDVQEIVAECWKILEPKVHENPKIKFQELMATHANGWNLDNDVIFALRNVYNSVVVDLLQELHSNSDDFDLDIDDNNSGNGNGNNLAVNAKKTVKQTVWGQLHENLQSPYKTLNGKALKFVKDVFEQSNENLDEQERKFKCLSILQQNSENLVKILKTNRKAFITEWAEIILLILQYMEQNKMKVGIDDVLEAFGFHFIDEFTYSLIQYCTSHTQILKVMTKLSKVSIVYQLVGCMRIPEMLNRWNMLRLVETKDLFARNHSNSSHSHSHSHRHHRKKEKRKEEEQKVNASIQLAIEVLKLLNIVTKGMDTYSNGEISKSQHKSLEEIQQNHFNFIGDGFALDTLYETISTILKQNLESAIKSNMKIFELCCQILCNMLSTNEPLIVKLLHPQYKRSKRIIYFLHKTYTDLRNNCRKRKQKKSKSNCSNDMDTGSWSSDDLFYNGTDSHDLLGNGKQSINRVIQPYEFKSFDDKSWEPYGVDLDVSQREDGRKLSNIDCRESIGDILLKYIEIVSNYDGNGEYVTKFGRKHVAKYKRFIAGIFAELLHASHFVKVSWGYNKALNHYHRDNICIEWIKSELLYQHALDGREHPDKNHQPQRHFRICALIEILFDPLIWDNALYGELLQKLCTFCIDYEQKTTQNLSTWTKLLKEKSKHKEQSIQETALMNMYTSTLWNEILSKCKAIVSKQKQQIYLDNNDLEFLQLLNQFVTKQFKADNTSNDISSKNNNDEMNEDKKDDGEAAHDKIEAVDAEVAAESKQTDKDEDTKTVDIDTDKENKNIEVGELLRNFEDLLRSTNQEALRPRGADNNNLVSQFVRSNILHLLVGLSQMEATCMRTRVCARKSIRRIIWTVNKKIQLLLKKSQIPFLPTINFSYKVYPPDLLQKNKEKLIISDKKQNILVIGDGNLSFGRALSRFFGNPSTKSKLKQLAQKHKSSSHSMSSINRDDIDYGARNIVVTCYESAMELLLRYPHSGGVVAEIMDRGAFVLYGIDATQLKQTLSASYSAYGGDKRAYPLFKDKTDFENFKYDIIVWNFPHAMDQSYNPKVNGDLVENFFISAKQILAPNGQIHVTLHINHQIEAGKTASSSRTYHQYQTWGIAQRAEMQQLQCKKRIELNHRLYSGYAIKNVQGNPFNIVNAETYVFKRIEDLA